jgi:hypothetical protein
MLPLSGYSNEEVYRSGKRASEAPAHGAVG